MMKRFLTIVIVTAVMLFPAGVSGKMGSGQVSAKSSDIDIVMFGSLKTYPTFMDNVDFNSNDTIYDRILDESGWMKGHTIRNELRLGWQGTGENWDFLITLEADFSLSKVNADRGANVTDPKDSGMTGEDFGVEKLNFGYNFGTFKLFTGWNSKFLDIRSGGILYGDDHPYIGLSGKAGSTSWEALYIIVQDDIETTGSGVFRSETLDWRFYSLRAGFSLDNFTLAPIYTFSDNDQRNASVHYVGVEGYGKLGILTPRFEVIYASGDQSIAGSPDLDIEAWGAYASVDFNISKAFVPYVGAYYLTGDSDPNDNKVEAFSGITNISRYTATFGMENAFIYRYVPVIGSHLYSNNFNTLGSVPGYGGISNSSKGDAPGMVMLGAGAKGSVGRFSYKTQIMYFQFEEQGALENAANYGKQIDSEVGIEFDLQLTCKFGKHFSIGNVLALFFPGDGIKDIRGAGYTETAFLDTIELKWSF